MSESRSADRVDLYRSATASRRASWIMTVFLIYYWALQLTRGDAVEMLSVEQSYYLYVVPAAAFAGVGILFMLTAYAIEKSAMLIIAFLGLVIAISFFRSDYRSIITVCLLSFTIACIFQMRPNLSINIINGLFIIAAVITTLLFFIGYSIYTFIPGIGLNNDLWWRISPYPSVAEGAIFATIVLLLNILLAGQPYRRLMILASAYFVVLSGNRTALIASSLAILYTFLFKKGILKRKDAQTVFFASIIALLLFLIYGSQILLESPLGDSVIIRTLILRDEALTGFDFGGQVGTAAIRQWIFDQHMAAFRDSPLIGIGTFDLSMLNSGYGALDNNASGSEAFVTGLIARIGLVSLPLFAAIFLVPQSPSDGPEEMTNAVRIALLIAMITYGSFVNAYDVVFVLMIVAITGGIRVPPTTVVNVAQNRSEMPGAVSE